MESPVREQVCALDPTTFEVVTTYLNANQTAKSLGVSRQHVHNCLHNTGAKQRTCKGYYLVYRSWLEAEADAQPED